MEVRISGEPRPLPAGIDVTAYRIVQEALTNALRHGDGAKAEVTVRYADHYLRVEVLNSGPSVLTGDRPPCTPRSDGPGAACSDCANGSPSTAAIWTPGGASAADTGFAPASRWSDHDRTRGPRVLIADDQALVRTGFRMILDARAGMTWSARPPTAPRRLQRSDGCGPTWCSWTSGCPTMDGLEAARRVWRGRRTAG